MTVGSHIIGLSRIGYKRDLKSILEKCFNLFDYESFNKERDFLNEIKKKILYKNWKLKILKNIDYINIGDFSFYDHILDNIFNFNFLPKRFNFKNNNLKNYFESAKGNKDNQPMEMTKWFNTNYHYVIPEYEIKTNFSFNNFFIKNDIHFAQLFKKNIKLIIVGPITLLKLGKIKDNKLKNRLLLLPKLLEIYIKILKEVNEYEHLKIIQIDEPIVILNLSKIWLENIKNVYNILSSYFSNIIFTSYFEEINKNLLNFLKDTPFFAIHIDTTIGSDQLNFFLKNNIKSDHISLGLIDGRNIWINNLEKSLYLINKFNNKSVILSTSCSLMHVPIDKYLEGNNIKKIQNWISFGNQKIEELNLLKNLTNNINNFLNKEIIKNIFFIVNKKKSKLIFINKIQKKIRKIDINYFKYRNNSIIRGNIQKKYFNFNKLITTTIGSFPQTKKIRKIRMDLKNKIINKLNYENLIKREINFIIKKQIDYDLNVIVHGEPERNDMVEYFAELLEGYIITNKGWVQSYGSRYVKPPIIYGDIYLKKYMTVNWIKYSQSLTRRPLKGILTGPITMIKWSFQRIDQPSYITAIQISLILNKEILKLEKIGIKIIQIDEPAIREFLPIKKIKYKNYFNWSIKSFLLIYKNLKKTTQIHSHICYSEFKNILNFIKDCDIDVISIETARSNFEITSILEKSNDIGLGIYDIHTSRIMDINFAIYLIKLIINNIDLNKIWINPDCGLKTRKWKDINKSLMNMTYSSRIISNEINFV